MCNAKEIAITDVTVDSIVKCMRCCKTRTQYNAAMLHYPARPNEQRPDSPNIACRYPAQHLLKPMIIESLDVVIEEAKDLAGRDFGQHDCSIEQS